MQAGRTSVKNIGETRRVGHDRVAVLDGGWDAWLKAGSPVTAQLPAPKTGAFSGIARDIAVDAQFVLNRLGQPHNVVIDARSPDRFRGENETLDPVGGHIPGALNRFFKHNLAATVTMIGVDCDGFDVRSGDNLLRFAFPAPVANPGQVRNALVALADE
jgi:3-mercaptopyruvate sulfurtransferase SseA